MKKTGLHLMIVFLLITIQPSINYAQLQTELWGMTSLGGINGAGTIFKTDWIGNNQSVQYSFLKAQGSYPYYTALCKAPNGKLYGLTSQGGIHNAGVLFEFDTLSGDYSVKVEFDQVNKGANPYGSLVLASNGKLYGMTSQGGIYGRGVLFEYDPSTDVFTRKINFQGLATGSNPYGNLIEASNGKLYGMTSNSGIYTLGVLFEYDPVLNTLTKKFDFDGTGHGSKPYGALIEIQPGKLYGLTSAGGLSGNGVIFEYDLLLDTCIKKLDFDGSNYGMTPYGSLLKATNGKLYGLTFNGGTNLRGTLFVYDPITDSCKTRVSFDGGSIGKNPAGSLVQALNGKLYGLTSAGGLNDLGVLFEYDLLTDTTINKLDFDGPTTGAGPFGNLMMVPGGKLYGLTFSGGYNDMGVLFEFTTTTGTYANRFEMGKSFNGSSPVASLMQASNGALYGLTQAGGSNDRGVLFEYEPYTGIYTKKVDFDGHNMGGNPNSTMVQANNGKLYGTTARGGANDNGVLFEFDPVATTYTVKVDFDGANMGSNPANGLLLMPGGKLYGMTTNGGINNVGVLFTYDPVADTLIKKLDFDGLNIGSNPFGGLIQVSGGILYGLTSSGGSNNMGTLFTFDTATNVCTKKWDFDGIATGSYPSGQLVQATNGKFYGMTTEGGADSLGVLFEYDPLADTVINKLDFDGLNNGSVPQGSLMRANNGRLYGMTNRGGGNGLGVLFQFIPSTALYTKRLDFDSINGANPVYTQLIEICIQPGFSSSLAGDTVCAGSNTFFDVVATGNGLSYHWQADSGSGFYNISNNSIYSGANTDSLKITGAQPTMNGYIYRCLVTSACPVKTIASGTAVLVIYYTNVSITGLDTLYCIDSPPATLAGNPSGGAFTGAGITANTFDPTAAGMGAHMVFYNFTDMNNCSFIDTAHVTVDLCIGMSEEPKAGEIKIYPNPNEGKFKIDLTSDEKVHIRIYNILGSLVYETSFEGRSSAELDLGSIGKGLYYIRIEQGTRINKVMKLIFE